MDPSGVCVASFRDGVVPLLPRPSPRPTLLAAPLFRVTVSLGDPGKQRPKGVSRRQPFVVPLLLLSRPETNASVTRPSPLCRDVTQVVGVDVSGTAGGRKTDLCITSKRRGLFQSFRHFNLGAVIKKRVN